MNCHEFHELLARYEDGDMTDAERANFEFTVKENAHLSGYHNGFLTALRLAQKHCHCAEPDDPAFPEERVAFIMTSVREMIVLRRSTP